MGVKVIKIGSPVITGSNHRSVVCDIDHGRYILAEPAPGETNSYTASELKFIPEGTKALKRTEIKPSTKKIPQVSAGRKVLNEIYAFLRKEFMLVNPKCQANLPGCTGLCEEIHHMRGRENLLLIIVKWFLPVCSCCHRRITDNSEEAINLELTLPRISVTADDLSPKEHALLDTFDYYGKKHNTNK